MRTLPAWPEEVTRGVVALAEDPPCPYRPALPDADGLGADLVPRADRGKDDDAATWRRRGPRGLELVERKPPLLDWPVTSAGLLPLGVPRLPEAAAALAAAAIDPRTKELLCAGLAKRCTAAPARPQPTGEVREPGGLAPLGDVFLEAGPVWAKLTA